MIQVSAVLLFFALFLKGCSGTGSSVDSLKSAHSKYTATGTSPEVLALYEGWFGHPAHITIDYSSHDPAVIRRQIAEAKSRGISAFVVDWYGDRQPFIDKSYALMQTIAAKEHFHVAMMYDESNEQEGATDEAIADFTMFYDTYLSAHAPGHKAYLTYQGRPVIFVFPTTGHTDWDRVRLALNKWDHPPLLIDEYLPNQYIDAFDGFYAWIHPGPKGWAADGSHWGKQYLDTYYRTMLSKYPDKMAIGGAWASFDDSKASWGLNRHISARCGQTFADTYSMWRQYYPKDQPMPFLMIETWNDYEEGSAVEPGIPTCAPVPPQHSPK